jgi:predicted Zn-dependent peptidase
VLSNEDLKKLTAADLVELIHTLGNYSHRIIYYGPANMTALTGALQPLHKMPGMFRPTPAPKVFNFTTQSANQVLFADFDMVQSEIRWVRNVPGYDPAKQPILDMFNNYFGGGMGSIVFQTIRESKALAYSTYSFYSAPDKKEDPYFVSAYVGCQADKFNEAIGAMNELLNDLPSVENNMQSAREAVKKNIETERITEDGIIFNYLAAERKGLKEDIRKSIYENADRLTFNDLKEFHGANMAHKPYTYCILASEKKLKPEDMQKIGAVKKLSMTEIFGY